MKSIISLVLAGILASSLVCAESLAGSKSAGDALSDTAVVAHGPPPQERCLCA